MFISNAEIRSFDNSTHSIISSSIVPETLRIILFLIL